MDSLYVSLKLSQGSSPNTINGNFHYFDILTGTLGEDITERMKEIFPKTYHEYILPQLKSNLDTCFPSFMPNFKLTSNRYIYTLLEMKMNQINKIDDVKVIYSFECNIIENKVEIWTVCKTTSPAYRSIRVNLYLKSILNSIFDTFTTDDVYGWLTVDFKNPFYKQAVQQYLRAGFEIKYVTNNGAIYSESHPNIYQINPNSTNVSQNLARDDPNNKVLIMECYKGKRSFDNPPIILNESEVAYQLNIALNIRSLEYELQTKSIVTINPDAWKLLFKKVIKNNFECAGVLLKKHITGSTNAVINKYSIFMNCEGAESRPTDICATTQVHPGDINFHTHPISCYLRNRSSGMINFNYNPPSSADLKFIFLQYSNNQLNSFHLVFTLSGIYVLQAHPYWKTLLKNRTKFSENCAKYIFYLLNFITDEDFPSTYSQEPNSAIKYINSSFSPNHIIKYLKKKGITIDPLYKSSCLIGPTTRKNFNRNMNLFYLSFIPYPINHSLYPNLTDKDLINLLISAKEEHDRNVQSGTLTQLHRKKVFDDIFNFFPDIPINIINYELTSEGLALISEEQIQNSEMSGGRNKNIKKF